MGKKLLLISSLNFSFQLMPIASHLPSTHCCKEPGSILLTGIPYRQGTATVTCPRAASSPGRTNPLPPATLDHLHGLHWTHPSLLKPLLHWGSKTGHGIHWPPSLPGHAAAHVHSLPTGTPQELLPGQAAPACTTAREQPSTTISPSSLHCSSIVFLTLTKVHKTAQNHFKSYQTVKINASGLYLQNLAKRSKIFKDP